MNTTPAFDTRDGQWHHAVARREGTEQTVWVDGTLTGTRVDPGEPFDIEVALIRLGNDNRAAGLPYDGLLDNSRLWSRALSDEEIISLADGAVPMASLISDLNSNGFVDFEDLTILLANWNKDVTAADGNLVEPLVSVVNFADLTVLLADWTGPGPAGSPEAALGEAVPEPSTLLLGMLAAFGLSFHRRRRRRTC
ncbi:MAG: LamG domain-containing protein [Planctomycetes bacterium]|nr:LamG domain-containing protein [Planctomycetota bacterium]